MQTRAGLCVAGFLLLGGLAGWLVANETIAMRALVDRVSLRPMDSRLAFGLLAALGCVVPCGRGVVPPVALWLGAVVTLLAVLCLQHTEGVTLTGVMLSLVYFGFGIAIPVALGALAGNGAAAIAARFGRPSGGSAGIDANNSDGSH